MRRVTPSALSAAALALALLLAGCNQARTVQGGEVTSCTGCHGGVDNTTGAPPRDLAGRAEPTLITVGAHTAHLAAGVRCEECHRVPAAVSDPGHIVAADGRPDPDRHAEVDLALGRGALRSAQPAWNPSPDRSTGTCSGVYCHGATLGAGGATMTPTWNAGPLPAPACGACHASPPPTASGHPSVPSDLAGCALCHPDTVNADGTIKAGGRHLDGTVQASGGHDDYTAPSVHGPAFLDWAGGVPGALTCTDCHGATYDGGIGPSCNACHAAAGWTGWQSNCSFCHGTKDSSTQAGYGVDAHPTWSAPPDAIAQRLDPAHAAVPTRTGAHQAHLTGVTAAGQSFAPPFTCATCHAVPGDLSHIGGSTSRATVALSGAAQAFLPASLGTYDQAAGTCATYCHGTSPSPAWATTGVACGSCHALPPSAASGHPSVPSDLTGCSLCHPETMHADGTLDLAGGKHLDGVRDAAGMHGDYSSPAVHGPRFFDFLAGTSSLDCKLCHGATYGGGVGPSCNACHAAAGWTGWQTNCSFCHGSKNAGTQAGYGVDTHPTWSAPPDAIAQRLDPAHAAVPARTGAHQAHLTGVTAGGQSFAPAFTCATCHAVPGDLSHIGGSTSRATVALAGAGQALLPAALGTYDQGTGTCATYCHGTAASPAWASTGVACGSCHALPPAPATGHPSVTGGLTTCFACHAETMNADGTLNLAGGKHLDGRLEVSGHGDFSSPAVHGPEFFGYLRGAGLDCRSCHGQDLNGSGSAPSCNGCHASAGWSASWQTNCSFCHGTRNATTQAGYDVASHPEWSAPPDAIAQRLTGNADLTRTGAHRTHLTGLGSSSGATYASPFPCATCHAVPADYAHAGGSGRAPVALVGSGTLPANLGTYDQASGTCTTYCHGSTLGTTTPPAWTGGELGCSGCHGYPPSTGEHNLHYFQMGYACADCHAATVTYPSVAVPNGTIIGQHVTGATNVLFNPASSTTTWVGNECTSTCHPAGGGYTWR